MSYHSAIRRRGLGVDIVQQGSSADTQSITPGSTGQNLGPLTSSGSGDKTAQAVTSLIVTGLNVAGGAIRAGQASNNPNAIAQPTASEYQLPSIPYQPGVTLAPTGTPGWVLPVVGVGAAALLGGLLYVALK